MTRSDLGHLDTGARMRRLFGDSAVYGLAGAVNKLLALITFPLLARHLSVSDYGTVDVYMIVANWLALIIMCGVDSATSRLMLDHPDDVERTQILSQALVWLALVAAVVVPAAWVAAQPLAAALGQPPSTARIMLLVCLQLPLLVVCSLTQSLLRWTFQRNRYLVLSLGSGAATALLLVAVTVSVERLKPDHMFIIGLIVQAAFATLGLASVRRWLVRPRSLALWRRLLPIAVPLGIVAATAALLPLMERFLVSGASGWNDGQALGLYAAGAKIAGLLALPIVAFQSGWGPFIVALSRERDAAATYNAALVAYAWSIGLLVLLLAGIGPLLVRGLASDRYVAGSVVVFPLAMALAVQSIGWLFEAGISISKRTHLSLAAYGLLLLAFVPLAFLLRAALGVAGVAYAMLAGQMCFAAVTAVLAQRAHALGWRPGPALAVLAATLAAGVAHALTLVLAGPVAAAIVLGIAFALLAAAGLVTGRIRSALSLLLRPRAAPPAAGD